MFRSHLTVLLSSETQGTIYSKEDLMQVDTCKENALPTVIFLQPQNDVLMSLHTNEKKRVVLHCP